VRKTRHKSFVFTLRKKGSKAVTRAVPFQKGKLLSILGTNMYILGANMDI